LGISLFVWMVIKLGWSNLPKQYAWPQLIGIAILAGIGFTMSVFITMLAFDNAAWQGISKLAVLLAGLVSVAGGLLVLGRTAR
ncbi:MAG: Na+/H+ antiporter NhaA, partial [Flavihumibacter sp.]